MSRYLFLPLSLALILAFSTPVHAAQAPAFKLPGDKGEISLRQHRNKVIYVDFWASWCVPCKHSFPWMNDLQEKYGKQGFRIIAINLDQSKDDALAFLEHTPAGFDIAYDPDGITAELYKVKVMPTAFLIDRKGNLVTSHKGFKIETSDKMEQVIRKLLKSK